MQSAMTEFYLKHKKEQMNIKQTQMQLRLASEEVILLNNWVSEREKTGEF